MAGRGKKLTIGNIAVLAIAGILYFLFPDTFKSILGPGGDEPAVVGTESVDVSGLPKTAKSFSTAKRYLYDDIYKGHKTTFYCGCKFNKNRDVSLGSCDVRPRKNEKRAKQLEAEHVFPAYHFGQHRQCWREPRKVCAEEFKNGKKISGRECCEETDPVFLRAHNDLHNLYPSVGEINGDRSNYRWGMIAGEARAYGSCDIEVDSSSRRAEPPESVRGEIARTYFYISETYGINLSDQQRKMFEAWNKEDPPD
ncbi:MAG: endonuclease, partial [Pseudomonadota bacterium]